MMKNNKYEIMEADYRKFVEINGVKRANTPAALEIRDRNLDYYIIYKNGEFYSDITLDKREYNLGLNGKLDYANKELMCKILMKLSEVTDYITFSLLNSDEKLNNIDAKAIIEVEKLFPNIKKEDYKLGGWSFFKYTLNIKQALLILSE